MLARQSRRPGFSKAFALVLVLGIPVLAGCAESGPEASIDPPEERRATSHVVAQVLPVEFRASDGVALRGHVHLPDAEGPFGTVLVYSPYWNEGLGRASDAEINFRFAHLLEAGFAIALVNLRGSGASDGCFSYMNVPQDGADAADVVQAIAQEEWSNGRVAMYGISYMAAVQYSLLAHGAPPELKALVPLSGTIDVWNLLGRHGAAKLAGSAHPITRDVDQGLGMGGVQADPLAWQPTPRHYCPSTAAGELAYQELALSGDKDAWFQARDIRAKIAGSKVPTFTTSGLTDGEGHIMQFDGLWDLLEGPKRFLLGQWPHAYPEGCDAERPPETCREDFLNLTIDFLHEHLRGGAPRTEMGIVEYQDDSLAWHTALSWPPRANLTRMHLSAGSLVDDVEQVEPSATLFLSSPQSPSPARCNPTQVLYVSPPIEQDVLLAGHFLVNLTLESTSPHGYVAAHLYHTAGDGVCPDGDAQEVRRAISTLRHRGGHVEQGRDFPLDEPDTVHLRSLPFATPVPAGHRLVLAVGGGSGGHHPFHHRPVLTSLTGEGSLAEVVLPVVEGELRFLSSAANASADPTRFQPAS